MRVLAIGATGQFAGLVVPALLNHGLQVRAAAHDPDKAAGLKELGVDEVVEVDLRDRASLDAALTGADGLYLIIPAFAPDTAEIGVRAVEAARAAGVRRVVFSGVYHPSLRLVNHAATRPIEEALYRSDLEFTVLQPAMYLQGLAGSWEPAVTGGTFAMPYSRQSAMSFVDFRDVAEVAALAFSSDRLVNGTFELAGGGTHTRVQIAAVMARHAGREVEAVDVSPEVVVGEMPDGFEKDGLTAMFDHYTEYGFHGGNSLVLSAILGRAPRTLDDYVSELAENKEPS